MRRGHENQEEVTPVERYAQLSPATREWLEIPRRPEDWKEIDEAVRFYRRIRSNGTFLFWFVGIGFSTFIGAVMFTESVSKIVVWVKKW